MVSTYKAFPISCESSLPLVASMRAARELSKDRSSGQSLFMPEEVKELEMTGWGRGRRKKKEEEEVSRWFDAKAKEENILFSNEQKCRLLFRFTTYCFSI